MAKEYWYSDYVKTLSDRFQSNLNTIEAEHGFDYGPEFEVAICKTLRSALPDRYGIARGFVVNAQSVKAGDDIVIFERSRFPTLRLHDRDDYSRKEYIPIEAAYCYIEAKHTLNLAGSDGQSLNKALDQVKKVKQVCSEREEIPSSQIHPYMSLSGAGVDVSPPADIPQIKTRYSLLSSPVRYVIREEPRRYYRMHKR